MRSINLMFILRSFCVRCGVLRTYEYYIIILLHYTFSSFRILILKSALHKSINDDDIDLWLVDLSTLIDTFIDLNRWLH